MANRRIDIAHRGAADVAQDRGAVDAFAVHRLGELLGELGVHRASHKVVDTQAHHRGGPALFGDDETAVAFLQHEQQVREAQVGDDLPIGDEMMQPFTVGIVEIRACGENL